MNERDLAKYYAGGRAGVGVLLLLFPGRLMRDIVGSSDRRAKAAGRMIGIRDLLLGAGALVAIGEKDGKTAHVRPWMTYGAVADGVDALAFLLAYRELPRRKRALFLLLALGGAATGGYLVSQIND